MCLLDLDYNLPVQVRDTALGLDKEDIPQSDVGKEFALNENVQRGEQDSSFGGAAGRPNDLILKLQRTTPYYKVSGLFCQPSYQLTNIHTLWQSPATCTHTWHEWLQSAPW